MENNTRKIGKFCQFGKVGTIFLPCEFPVARILPCISTRTQRHLNQNQHDSIGNRVINL